MPLTDLYQKVAVPAVSKACSAPALLYGLPSVSTESLEIECDQASDSEDSDSDPTSEEPAAVTNADDAPPLLAQAPALTPVATIVAAALLALAAGVTAAPTVFQPDGGGAGAGAGADVASETEPVAAEPESVVPGGPEGGEDSEAESCEAESPEVEEEEEEEEPSLAEGLRSALRAEEQLDVVDIVETLQCCYFPNLASVVGILPCLEMMEHLTFNEVQTGDIPSRVRALVQLFGMH